jgi:hypothetical protein
MSISLEASATWPVRSAFWHGRVVRGSAILLLSTGLVSATNLLYNLLIARMLGASGFGHASALYTLLMLVTAVTLAFQIVTSKFIARNSEVTVQAQIYATLLRRAWQVGLGVTILLAAGSAFLKSYLNLPAQRDLLLLAVAAGVYIPLGVRRGRMQGCYHFGNLALNLVAEVAVKFGGALIFLHFGMGVTGVMVAILLSITTAYAAGWPGTQFRARAGMVEIAPFGEGMQAIMYFVGQVILSNLDIILVKHFFPPPEAGIYAAVALVGRVVFMVSWSVVSSMFPVSACHTKQTVDGRSVLLTALVLVGGLVSIFMLAVSLAPEWVWTMLLGKQFLLGTARSFSTLLTEYGAMTGVYCMAVVVMMYEISRRIGTAAWVQLGASLLMAAAIWRYHHSFSQVILVQGIVMGGLLFVVVISLFLESDESASSGAIFDAMRCLRPVAEEEVIAEFLRGEFYHPEYDSYRQNFKHLVDRMDLDHSDENSIRRALLFRRRGGLWRELPADTKWWEVELTSSDLVRLQSFPRNEWKRFAGGGFSLTEMVGRIEKELSDGNQSKLLTKLGEIAIDLRENDIPDAVVLIGVDTCHPLTIIEGNHRMIAAMLAMPESAHRRFRFYCGLSPHMNSCCWHKTDLRSIMRYIRHVVYVFRDADVFIARTLRQKLTESEMS